MKHPEYDWHRSAKGSLFLRRWPNTHRQTRVATVYRRNGDDSVFGYHITRQRRHELSFPSENEALEACYLALGWRFD